MAIETALDCFTGEDRDLNIGVGDNVSAMALAFSIAPTYTGTAAVTKTTAGGGITFPASSFTHPDGTVYTLNTWFRVSLSRADLLLDPGVYRWQSWVTSSGSEEVIAFGTLKVRAGKLPV